MSELIHLNLERAREVIRFILQKASAPIKNDGFKGWDEYFAAYEVVDVSLSYDDIKKLGAALKELPIVSNAQAHTLGDLVTPKQLWTIRKIGREIDVDVEKQCASMLHCPLEQISKHAAKGFIEWLEAQQPEVKADAASNQS